jgi:hypothetical protein
MTDENVDDFMPPPEFFEHAAKDCKCCPDCEVAPPCDGCCAGGICDHGQCTCGEDDEPCDENDE